MSFRALSATLALVMACSTQAEPEPAPVEPAPPAEVAPPPKAPAAPPRAPLEDPNAGDRPDGAPVTAATLGLKNEPAGRDADEQTAPGDEDPGPPCKDANGKHYVAPAKACGTIEFDCADGQKRFDDGCGCGCRS